RETDELKGGSRACPRSLFSRASSILGAPRVRTRGDLRTVMTSEAVPVEQQGTVVDELCIRDQTVETGYAERVCSGRKAVDEERSRAVVSRRDSHRRPMGGRRQDQVLSDTEWPSALSKERCAVGGSATGRARRSEWPLIRGAVRESRPHTDEGAVIRGHRRTFRANRRPPACVRRI